MQVENERHPIRNTVIGIGAGAIGGVAAGAIRANTLLGKELSDAERKTLASDLLVKCGSKPTEVICDGKNLVDIILSGKSPITNRELRAKQYLQKLDEIGKFPKRLMNEFHCLISPNVDAVGKVNPSKIINAEAIVKNMKMIKYGLIGTAICGAAALIGTYISGSNSKS